jgi:small subunit ribosomal protein S2
METQTQSQVSLMSLYQVGAQRGNRKSRLNPKLKDRVYGYVGGLCLIDLVKTQSSLSSCSELLYKLGQKRRQILIVGTSRHIAPKVEEYAAKFEGETMPFVNSRWLGGTITNWSTIKKTLKSLEKLQKIEENKDFFSKLSKNEQLNLKKKKEKILRFFKGLVNLKSSRPGAVLVLDANSNPIAIKEAESAGIPVIALTNTTVDVLPKNLKYTVVSNVNSTKSVDLIMNSLIEAYNTGVQSSLQKVVTAEGSKDTKKS